MGTKAIFAGGYASTGPSGVIDVYDNSTGVMQPASYTLSVPRYSLAATTVGTKAIFAGGDTSSRSEQRGGHL